MIILESAAAATTTALLWVSIFYLLCSILYVVQPVRRGRSVRRGEDGVGGGGLEDIRSHRCRDLLYAWC